MAVLLLLQEGFSQRKSTFLVMTGIRVVIGGFVVTTGLLLQKQFFDTTEILLRCQGYSSCDSRLAMRLHRTIASATGTTNIACLQQNYFKNLCRDTTSLSPHTLNYLMNNDYAFHLKTTILHLAILQREGYSRYCKYSLRRNHVATNCK